MIICCGEALIDMLPIEAKDGRDGVAPAVGGSVFNTAIALGRLGGTVALHSKVAKDSYGTLLIDALTASNVQTDLLKHSDLPSPLAMVHLRDGHATYQFYDDGTAAQDFAPHESFDVPSHAKLAFFGGISLLGAKSGPYYRRLLDKVSRQIPVMVDPNIRPDFIQDEAKYRADLYDMLAHTSILKVSDDDLDWIAKGGDPVQQIHAMLDTGVKLILVTKGGDGVEAISHKFRVHTPAAPAKVVDTVGAGDTFSAGFLCALQENDGFGNIEGLSKEAILQAANLGAQAAAITVARHGANPPWRAELL